MLDDRLVLDRLFLDADVAEEPQIREAIGQQIKYLFFPVEVGLHFPSLAKV